MATKRESHQNPPEPPQTPPTASSDGVAASRRSERGAVRRIDSPAHAKDYRSVRLELGDHRVTVLQQLYFKGDKAYWGDPQFGSSCLSGFCSHAEEMVALIQEAIAIAKQWRVITGQEFKF